MLFPITRFAKQNTILEQLDHLQSEINEVREAVEGGDLKAASLELVDVQQSADTALHILAGITAPQWCTDTSMGWRRQRKRH